MKLEEFVLIVKDHLQSWQTEIPNREIKLLRCLKILFDEIDLNGNGDLEWDEFTNYIIEKATVLNNIKTRSDEIKSYTKSHIKPFQLNIIGFDRQDDKNFLPNVNYNLISKANKKINYKFQNMIPKIIYMTHINKLAFFEDMSNEILFMNPDSGQMGMPNGKPLKIIPKPLIIKISSVKKDKEGLIQIDRKDNIIELKTCVLDILYIQEQKYQVLLTSTNDCYIRGWKYTTNGWILAPQPDNEEELIEHHFNHEIYCLAWNQQSEALYCGQKDGKINMWNFKTDTETVLECEDGHCEIIMDMIAMPKLQFLASASMDSKLILWETIHHEKKRTFIEHTRGIVSLAFNESLILLFSAGFDHDVCVWNPYIGNLIYKITGHSSPLLCVKVIDGTSQVVTLDSDGVVKITDIKKFNNVQTFSMETSDEKHKFTPQCFTYIPKPLKLAFCGRSISIYEYDKNYNPKYVDDYVAICCIFVPSQLAFYTPAGNKIKLWNALTGDIKKIFSDITIGEITVFKLDILQKRMMIGDSLGNTGLYNVCNGAKIKHLPKHQGEVLHFVHAPSIKAFLTGGMDSVIHMTLDNDFGENELIRMFQLKEEHFLITSLNFEINSKMIIIGTNNGIIQFYESETGKLNGSYSENLNHEEINNINFIPRAKYFLITTCNTGKINFIAMGPLLYKYQKVFSFSNYDTDSNIPIQDQSISNCIYCEKQDYLFISDEIGYIKCYDIKTIIDILEQAQQNFHKSFQKSIFAIPKFNDINIKPIWQQKAHNEAIKSLEYVYDEQILTSTAYDKKVRIWNSKDGNLIDSFQQNYDKVEPCPIGFKRGGTNEIYNVKLENRIDLFQNQQKKNNSLPNNGKQFSLINIGQIQEDKNDKNNFSQNNNINKNIQKKFLVQQNSELDQDEEFNPFYYQDKIDKTKLETIRSNPDWHLHINFKKYYELFESCIANLLQQVITMKKEQKQIQGMTNKRLKITQFINDDEDTKQFDVDNKPLITEKHVQANMDNNPNNKLKDEIKKKKFGHHKRGYSINNCNSIQIKQNDDDNNNVWEILHKREQLGKLLQRNVEIPNLSKEACNAAHKLAAALANYDKYDCRNLQFRDYEYKEQKRIKQTPKKIIINQQNRSCFDCN